MCDSVWFRTLRVNDGCDGEGGGVSPSIDGDGHSRRRNTRKEVDEKQEYECDDDVNFKKHCDTYDDDKDKSKDDKSKDNPDNNDNSNTDNSHSDEAHRPRLWSAKVAAEWWSVT